MARVQSINILTPCVVPNDAISTDVLGTAAALRDAGHTVHVFAGGVHPSLQGAASLLSGVGTRHWSKPEDLLIYHHSMAWPEGERIAETTNNTVVLKYHNITPAAFFEPYSGPHFDACKAGIASTRRLAKLPDAWFWGDSQFNTQELIGHGAPEPRCRVLPPMHAVADLANQTLDYSAIAPFKDNRENILFVGGFKPNKAHARLIRVFAEYHHVYNRRSRLILAGSLDPAFEDYVGALRRLAASLGVLKDVVFCFSVSPAQLRALYLASHVFLCLSEHEGFCVPLLEAMFFRVPIVAWATTAVPETIGPSGLMFRDYSEPMFAEAINSCTDDSELSATLRRLGRERYQSRFDIEILRGRLLELIKEVERV
ncbi:MAG TPA: glycosyltransferase family 4 protein [Bryobacteraceae bacterium]|nr:glycosyltransferase family 4 protein [Bryobacteraceae bacterium]